MNIQGGVTAPKGFTAGAVHCGIRKNTSKLDLAVIKSETLCTAAAVYTQNKVFGAPITVTRENIANGHAKLFICNSGNANTCNANGVEIAQKMCALASEQFDVDPTDVIIASTGVIGQPLDVSKIESGVKEIKLDKNGSEQARVGIMTTDLVHKELAIEFKLSGRTCRIGTIAKGSGMIQPNMATMLGFITTDVAISPEMLQKALSLSIADSYNMVSVDGDTSTNDMVAVLANGMAENPLIDHENTDFEIFSTALAGLNTEMAKKIAKDGEGATKLLSVSVRGACDTANAKVLAKSVVNSSLVKTAIFGCDANWGRILCALGYAGADFDPMKTNVCFTSAKGKILVCENGFGVDFSEEKALEILKADEITIDIALADGEAYATAYGCDLTYEYVKINGDYRT